MKHAQRFQVQPGWKLLIADMGINPGDVLRLAGLPGDLFTRRDASLTPKEFFALWSGLEQVAGAEELPLQLGQAISVEAFDPPIFASLCSPDLNTALQRLSTYKRLIGPMKLHVSIDAKVTSATLECLGADLPIPGSFAASEAVFLTKLARLGTRCEIRPVDVTLTHRLRNPAPYEAFLGARVKLGDSIRVAYSAADAQRPFLTENLHMWQTFEPELNRRLADLEREATTAQRVKSVLLEMLPGGETTMNQAAQRLAMSKRTLQRRLGDEQQTFQGILQNTRRQLAQHYLANSELSPGEISFLLGFQDSNSFIRAYSGWTGQTPGQFRQASTRGMELQ